MKVAPWRTRLFVIDASSTQGERLAATRSADACRSKGEAVALEEPDWLGRDFLFLRIAVATQQAIRPGGRMAASPSPLPPRMASPQIVREQEEEPSFLLLANDGGRSGRGAQTRSLEGVCSGSVVAAAELDPSGGGGGSLLYVPH